jgi:hypothetical protein
MTENTKPYLQVDFLGNVSLTPNFMIFKLAHYYHID